MEKHISLKGYPVLYFFANIVDPEGRFGVDDIVKTVCTKFELDLPNTEHGYSTLNNKLIKFVENEYVRELFFELPIYGFVRVYKEYRLLKYKEHTMNFNYYTELQVNTNHTERKSGWDDDKMNHFKDVMFALYDKDEHRHIIWMDIFDACWLIFDKGSKDNARNTFERTIELLINKLEDDKENNTTGNLYKKYAYFIKEKWDEYLWSKYNAEIIQNTDYWLGLQEFINRNVESWLDGLDNHVISCRIYTDEHDDICKQFNLIKESSIKVWGSIVNQGVEN
jgi:hypothetical protein